MKTMDDGAAARLHLPTQQNLSSRLDQLPRRALGRVTGLLPAQDAQEHRMLLRLLEIGFLPGETVQVVARGGWGGSWRSRFLPLSNSPACRASWSAWKARWTAANASCEMNSRTTRRVRST